MISIQVIQQYYWILALEAEEIQLKASLKSAEQLLHNMKIALDTQSILEWQYQKAQAYYKQKISLSTKSKRFKIGEDGFIIYFKSFSSVFRPITENTKYNKRKEDNYEEVIYQALVHNDALGIQEKVLEVEKEKLKISFSRFLPVIGLQGFMENIAYPY